MKRKAQRTARAVERLRAEVAHTQLTSTTVPIESIARSVGFANAERMRRAFLRVYGAPPQSVRRVPSARLETEPS